MGVPTAIRSHLGDAAKYALNRWPELVRYAKPGCGHVNIDQNAVEGNIRPTKIGAKNWMHIGHPKAGWRSAIIYTVVGTCRLLKIDPQAYLSWVLPDFHEWDQAFPNNRLLASATVDRLRHNAYCLELEGDSGRHPKVAPPSRKSTLVSASKNAHS